MRSPLVFKGKVKQVAACFKAIGQYFFFFIHSGKETRDLNILCVFDFIIILFILLQLQVLFLEPDFPRLSMNERQILHRQDTFCICFIMDLKRLNDTKFFMSKGIPCGI